MGGFVRSTWEEVSELVAASVLHTATKYEPDRRAFPDRSSLQRHEGRIDCARLRRIDSRRRV